MKKRYLFLMILVPTLVGYIYNLLLVIPLLGFVLFYSLPFLMLIYWFWVGNKFAKLDIHMIISILLGNLLGIISILIYFWQFIFVVNEDRNLFLAGFSQMFSACTNLLTARIAILFEPTKNVISQITSIAMQVLGLILMIIVFSAGYLWRRRKHRASTL